MSSVTVTPTGNATPSKITVNGITVTSGTSSGAVNLSAGANTIAVVVISQDTVHNDTYTVIVTRALPLTVDDLTSLTISPGTLSPDFGSGTTTYTGSIATGVNAVTVTPTVAESSYATITVNGNAVTGGSRTINLNVGSNTITIAVTAQDGTTTKSYIVTINATALPTTTASPTTTTQTTEVVQPPPAATTTTTTTPTTTTTTTPTTTTTSTTPITTLPPITTTTPLSTTTSTTTTTLPPGTTNLSGDVNSTGTFTSSASASSANDDVTVNIPAGVTGLTASGAPVTQITIIPITTDLPALPSDGAAVGLYFDIQPSGSTFSSPITITVSYDPSLIPTGSDPYVAWYNPATGQWENLTTVSIDTVNHTITASVDHFSTFAVLAALSKTSTTTSTAAGTATNSTKTTATTTTTPTKPTANGVVIGVIIGAVFVIALILFFIIRGRKPRGG